MFHLAPTFHVGNHNARAPLPEVLEPSLLNTILKTYLPA